VACGHIQRLGFQEGIRIISRRLAQLVLGWFLSRPVNRHEADKARRTWGQRARREPSFEPGHSCAQALDGRVGAHDHLERSVFAASDLDWTGGRRSGKGIGEDFDHRIHGPDPERSIGSGRRQDAQENEQCDQAGKVSVIHAHVSDVATVP